MGIFKRLATITRANTYDRVVELKDWLSSNKKIETSSLPELESGVTTAVGDITEKASNLSEKVADITSDIGDVVSEKASKAKDFVEKSVDSVVDSADRALKSIDAQGSSVVSNELEKAESKANKKKSGNKALVLGMGVAAGTAAVSAWKARKPVEVEEEWLSTDDDLDETTLDNPLKKTKAYPEPSLQDLNEDTEGGAQAKA